MNRRAWATGTLLFLVALGVRLLYLAQLRADPLRDDLYQIFDSVYYHREGAAIALGDWGGSAPYFLSPLYSWLIGVVYALAGTSTQDLRVAQAFLGAASCVLVYAIGRRVFNENAGIVAGAALALYGLQIYYTGIMLPAVFVLFLNLTFLFVMIGDRRGEMSILRCLTGGLLAGLAAVAKSNALLLVPAAMMAIWFTREEAPRRTRALSCAALALGAALTIAPFTLRNYEVSNHFVLIGTTTGRNLWKGNGPHATGTHVQLPPGDIGIGLWPSPSRSR